jgi:hypothetical protein
LTLSVFDKRCFADFFKTEIFSGSSLFIITSPGGNCIESALGGSRARSGPFSCLKALKDGWVCATHGRVARPKPASFIDNVRVIIFHDILKLRRRIVVKR